MIKKRHWGPTAAAIRAVPAYEQAEGTTEEVKAMENMKELSSAELEAVVGGKQHFKPQPE